MQWAVLVAVLSGDLTKRTIDEWGNGGEKREDKDRMRSVFFFDTGANKERDRLFQMLFLLTPSSHPFLYAPSLDTPPRP
jgi:hypothetical protein